MDKRWLAALRFIGIGWYIAVCIVLGVFLGLWLDSRFDTAPLLVLMGLFLGLGTAALGTYRLLTPIMRDKEKE